MSKYRTIVADPPWPFQWQGGAGGRRRNASTLGYETMSYEDIAAFPLPFTHIDLNATLLMWGTQDAIHSGWVRKVCEAWEFKTRVGEFIWRKPNFGTGNYPRAGHETCVIYKRGLGSLRPDRPKNVHSVQDWRQAHVGNNGGKKHSAKPDGLCDRAEEGFLGPYLEVFARRARFGWDYLGDQSLETGVAA